MNEFKKAVPAEDFASISDSVHKQFEMGYLDPELEGFLVRQLPPANLQEVSFLKTLDLNRLSDCSRHLVKCENFIFQSFHVKDVFCLPVKYKRLSVKPLSPAFKEDHGRS